MKGGIIGGVVGAMCLLLLAMLIAILVFFVLNATKKKKTVTVNSLSGEVQSMFLNTGLMYPTSVSLAMLIEVHDLIILNSEVHNTMKRT